MSLSKCSVVTGEPLSTAEKNIKECRACSVNSNPFPASVRKQHGRGVEGHIALYKSFFCHSVKQANEYCFKAELKRWLGLGREILLKANKVTVH